MPETKAVLYRPAFVYGDDLAATGPLSINSDEGSLRRLPLLAEDLTLNLATLVNQGFATIRILRADDSGLAVDIYDEVSTTLLAVSTAPEWLEFVYLIAEGAWSLIARGGLEADADVVVNAVGPSVRVATTAALPAHTRSGNTLTASADGALGPIDGATLVDGDTLLVLFDDEENGGYVLAQGTISTPWTLTRASWLNESSEAVRGLLVGVREGAANGGRYFVLATAGAIVLNTTALAFHALYGYDGTSLLADSLRVGASGTQEHPILLSTLDAPYGLETSSIVDANGFRDDVLSVGYNIRRQFTAHDPTDLRWGFQIERGFAQSLGSDTHSEFWFGFMPPNSNEQYRLFGATFNQNLLTGEFGVSARMLVGEGGPNSEPRETNFRFEENGDLVAARAGAFGFVAEGFNRTLLAADRVGAGGFQVVLQTKNDTEIEFANAWTVLDFALPCDFLQRPTFSTGINLPANQYIFAGSTQLLGVDNFAEVTIASTANITILQASNGGGHGLFFNIGGINAVARNEGWSIGNGSTGAGTSMLLDLVSTSRAFGVPSMTGTQMNAITPRNGSMVYNTTDDKFYGRAGGAWVALH